MESSKKMVDPINGSDLIEVGNNLYRSEGTGYHFTYDEVRKCFIPNYIPDENLFEFAHREGDYLVGDVTGARYKIDENGKILTPSEIEFQKMHQEGVENLKKMYEDKISEISDKSQKHSWMIERGIDKIDSVGNVGLEDYLKETIKMRENETSWPMLYEFQFDENKCYYCAFEIIPQDLKNKFALSNDKCIQARIFDDGEQFNAEFFKPFIKYQVVHGQGIDLRELPGNAQDVGNFCLITAMGDMVITRGIDRQYLDSISQIFECNEEVSRVNSVRR